jgi:2-hydroxychromene-2-carboxylate isomerase
MADPIDFYFDYSSPYGYIAAMKIDAFAARHKRSVNWKPVLLGAVFKVTGAQPLPTLPLKGEYALRDIPRSARFHGLAYRHPSKFPIAGQAPARAFYWVDDRDPALAHQLARTLYEAYFVNDLDISSPAVTADVAAKLGLSRDDLLAAIASDSVKARLKTEVEAALARNVFGSPYFIIDGEPFWGVDRFDQMERWLTHGPF